jgi:hypothetical protein
MRANRARGPAPSERAAWTCSGRTALPPAKLLMKIGKNAASAVMK